MCRGHDNDISIEVRCPIAAYSTLEKVLQLDQKLSNLHSAMMECSTCSSDPTRTTSLLRELEILCTLYVAGQANFSPSGVPIDKDSNESRAELGDSTFQLGRYVLDSEECRVVGRIVVKQGLDHLQKKLQIVQVEQRRNNCATMQNEISAKVQGILSKVWEASAYGCL
jgi:hypothetical protein